MSKFKLLILKLIKSFKHYFFRNRSRQIFFYLSLIFLVFIIYFIIAWLSVSRVEVALVEYRDSFLPEIICHEECHLYRQMREQIIVKGLKDGFSKNNILLQKYFEEESAPIEFRKELIKIISFTYGKNNPPEYLRLYILSDKAEPVLIREAIVYFDNFLGRAGEFKNSLATKIMQAKTKNEKIEWMKILREINNDTEINEYFTVLSGDEDELLKCEILKNISLTKDKRAYFTLEQLELIGTLIFNPDTGLRLRRDLVLLIGDYFLVFPEESASLWREIYVSENLDSISRLFAADNLNHLLKEDLILPLVSSSEWNEYYNY